MVASTKKKNKTLISEKIGIAPARRERGRNEGFRLREKEKKGEFRSLF